MPKQIIQLTNAECKKLKYDPVEKKNNYLRDGHGLYLEALVTGRKVWRYEYRLGGKKSRISMSQDYGSNDGGLIPARLWREQQRQLVKQGINPSQHSKQSKAEQLIAQEHTFKSVADEWLEHHKSTWSSRHYQKAAGIVRRVLRPILDDRPIDKILTHEVLSALQVPEKQGKNETAHNARGFASQIFKRAIVRQLIANDPTYPIRGSEGLKPVISTNRSHLTSPDKVAELHRKLDSLQTRSVSVTYALKILPLVFTRPTELRDATWQEFDLESGRWVIPVERMKTGKAHIVPLSTQVVTLLEELALYSHRNPESLLFPSESDKSKPITDASLSKALLTLGYRGLQVPHGFRHTASTLLNAEQKFSADAIEMQLSHAPKDKIRGTYNKWEYLPERIDMMQYWADLIDKLKKSNTVLNEQKLLDDTKAEKK